MVMVVLLISFILCLPFLELVDYNDLILTGQDTELTVLNLLTILGVWFVLILSLLAVLPTFRNCLRVPVKVYRYVGPGFRILLSVLFLPDELSSPCDPFPLLI